MTNTTKSASLLRPIDVLVVVALLLWVLTLVSALALPTSWLCVWSASIAGVCTLVWSVACRFGN